MKINFGNGVNDARGKQNGTVFSKNRTSAYVRSKVTPVNRNTSFQSAVRSLFSAYSKAWGSTLTEQQRGEWIAYARITPFRDIFGNQRFLTGHNQYIAHNVALVTAGMSPVTDPPTVTDTGLLGGLTLSMVHSGAMTLTTNEVGVAGTSFINVYATSLLSPGIYFVKTALRLIGTFASAGSPYDIKSAWIAKYGTYPSVAGKKVFVAAQIITLQGELSVPESTSTLVS